MKKILLMVVALTFVWSATGMAREPRLAKDRMTIPPVKWWKMPQVAEKLSLTKEETEKLDTMYFEQRSRMIDLRSQLAKNRLEMEQLFDKEPFDANACLSSFKKSQDARNVIGLERFKFLIKVREMLGTERFQVLKAEFREHRAKRKIGRTRTPRTDRPPT